MKMRKPLVIIIYVAILALALSWLLGLFNFNDGLTDSQVAKLLQDGKVKSFVVEDGTITLKLHEPYEGKTSVSTDLADVDAFRSEMWPVIQAQMAAGTLENYDFVPGSEPSAFDLVLPLLITGIILLYGAFGSIGGSFLGISSNILSLIQKRKERHKITLNLVCLILYLPMLPIWWKLLLRVAALSV